VIALMMEAVQTYETLVHSYQSTRRYNPEDSHLYIHGRENLRSYKVEVIFAGEVFILCHFKICERVVKVVRKQAHRLDSAI
jgi:hypothetical protein